VDDLPNGTYIFSDLDRLTKIQAALAALVWEQLALGGRSVQLLNHPQRSRRRYELPRAV
jgi:hypothetical protein